jgi:hypothetical protein
VRQQTRVVVSAGHRDRFLGVYHRLLLLAHNSERERETAKNLRGEGIVFRPQPLQSIFEQENHARRGETAKMRRLRVPQSSIHQVVGS